MKINITGLKETRAALRNLSARATDLSPVLRVAVNDLRSMEADAFRKATDPGTGEVWDALSEKTLARRRKRSAKPLSDTGVLKNSLVTKNANSIERVGKGFILFGSTVPYAAVHQDGSKKKRIPQRAFLPRTFDIAGTPANRVLAKIISRIRNYILKGKTSPEKTET